MPLSVGGAGSPSNTMWPVLRPTSTPSDVLNLDPSNRLATTHSLHRDNIGLQNKSYSFASLSYMMLLHYLEKIVSVFSVLNVVFSGNMW